MHTVFIVCGSPGAGKSTFAKKLASTRRATLLDIDTVTEGLVQLALREAGRNPDDRDSEYFKRTFREPIYETLFAIALENLPFQNVVVVGPFTGEMRDPGWPARLSKFLGSKVEVYYVHCPAETRKQRLSERGDARDLAKLQDWEDFIRYYDELPPVFEHILIDGTKHMNGKAQIDVDLRPWSKQDLPLLQRLRGDPAMNVHLGGPEAPEKILERQERYYQTSLTGINRMFVIVVGPERVSAGSIGYWEKDWQGEKIWETGWSVLPEFQGQGVATQATHLLIERSRATGIHRFLHAFPGVNNAASNAICSKTGFTLRGEVDFEFPPGHIMRCNDWYLDLFADNTK
jgi:RimJ/RimL family protein N-acetyltransferase/predicted kinase